MRDLLGKGVGDSPRKAATKTVLSCDRSLNMVSRHRYMINSALKVYSGGSEVIGSIKIDLGRCFQGAPRDSLTGRVIPLLCW